MEIREYDAVIVGSGTGGGTLARELACRGKSVLVVERGRRFEDDQLGTFRRGLAYWDLTPIKTPPRSEEGVIVWRTLMAGGSSTVSCGNAMPCLVDELAAFGITLDDEFAEFEQETQIITTPEDMLSEGSLAIREAADRLGYTFERMPKFINPEKCTRCSMCVLGCQHGARWTAREYLSEAEANGAEFAYQTHVSEVLIENGRAVGVRGRGPGGPFEARGESVVLAAGGVGTPVILQRSGVEAGEGLFIDVQVMVYGLTDGINQLHEPQMAIVCDEFHAERGFVLSPFVNYIRNVRLMEAGPAAFAMPNRRLIGLMVKQADDATGRVYADGTVSKDLTAADRERVREGTAICEAILSEAGADPASFIHTNPAGSHPGGTAAIGRVVDANLRTEVEGLYVCDASALPRAPGKPPIMTIAALAKRLAKHFAA